MNNDEYLRPDEVKQITGTTVKSVQKIRLEKQGYPFAIAYDGKPLVSRWYARAKATGQETIAPTGPRLELVR